MIKKGIQHWIDAKKRNKNNSYLARQLTRFEAQPISVKMTSRLFTVLLGRARTKAACCHCAGISFYQAYILHKFKKP